MSLNSDPNSAQHSALSQVYRVHSALTMHSIVRTGALSRMLLGVVTLVGAVSRGLGAPNTLALGRHAQAVATRAQSPFLRQEIFHRDTRSGKFCLDTNLYVATQGLRPWPPLGRETILDRDLVPKGTLSR